MMNEIESNMKSDYTFKNVKELLVSVFNHEIKFNELPKFLNMNYEHIAQIRDENYLDKLQYA